MAAYGWHGCGGWNQIRLTGLDWLSYYYWVVHNFMEGYSWQVNVSYFVLVGSVLTMLVLTVLIVRQSLRICQRKRKERFVDEHFKEALRELAFAERPITAREIEERLGRDEEFFRTNDYQWQLLFILSNLSFEREGFPHPPNFQLLCDFLQVTRQLKDNLLHRRDIFASLIRICLLQVRVPVGCLANYLGHGDADIRNLARLCYVFCCDNEPFRYLLEVLDGSRPRMALMVLHHLFARLHRSGRHLPHFLLNSDRVRRPSMAAFLIREVAYYGTEEEKGQLPNYYCSERLECRLAAVEATGLLRRAEFEDRLVESYSRQPEHVRRAILHALWHIRSGRQVQFFVDAYHNTPSKGTQLQCLRCLYNYSEEGLRAFEHIRETAAPDALVPILQVEQGIQLARRTGTEHLLRADSMMSFLIRYE